jgi:hypothetical protein
MIAAEREVSADKVRSGILMDGDYAARLTHPAERERVDRRQRQIRREAERQPSWQHDTVARREGHRIRNAFDGEPTVAGDDGITFNASMSWKLNSQISSQRKAT